MNILIVSPAYAPFGGVGSARMISLSEYLVSNGDQVTVLCDAPSSWSAELLTRTVPKGVVVHHVDVRAENEMTLANTYNSKAYHEALRKLVSQIKPDICLCSIGPYYVMKFIWRLAEECGLRYVIDYRDYWFTAYRKGAGLLRNAIRLYTAARLFPKERKCLKHATAVVGVVEPFNGYLSRLHPIVKDKICCIRNGYDETAMAAAAPMEPCSGTPSLVLTGKFAIYNPAAAAALFEAVAMVNARGYGLKIVHIGPAEARAESLMRTCSNFDPDDFVTLGHKPYDECLSLIKGARVCLINYTDMRGLGTKIYDYIGANKPIIAFTPEDSEMARVLATFPHAYRCTSADDAVSALTDIIDNQITTLYDTDTGMEYSRGASNQRYRELLTRLCPELKGAGIQA